MKRMILPLALALAGCHVVDPIIAPGAEEIRPPAEYVAWAGQVLDCLGIHESPSKVVHGLHWVVADALDAGGPGDSGLTVGLYSAGTQTIYLLHDAANLPLPVKHEIIHAVVPGHDTWHVGPYWRCER